MESMPLLRYGTRRSYLRRMVLQRRYFVKSSASRADQTAGEHVSAQKAAHDAPGKESMGRGFYVSIAVITGFLAVYKFSRSSYSDPSDAGNPEKQPFLTRLIHRWDSIQEEFRKREVLQVGYLDAAGRDRRTFQEVERSGYVDLRFPETFNSASVRNVVAGSQANLDELYGHYDRQREEMVKQREERAKRVERIRRSHGISDKGKGI